MALPKPSQLIHTHTVTLGEGTEVSFQIVALPGDRYQELVDEHRDPETGKTPWERVAVPLLAASIPNVYSSIESTPVEFTVEDAEEVWTTWPEWARWSILAQVINDNTVGPAANPFTNSMQKESAGK